MKNEGGDPFIEETGNCESSSPFCGNIFLQARHEKPLTLDDTLLACQTQGQIPHHIMLRKTELGGTAIVDGSTPDKSNSCCISQTNNGELKSPLLSIV